MHPVAHRAAAPTPAGLIREAADRLAAAGFDSARLDAEVLLRHVLGLTRAQLFTVLRDPIRPDAAARFNELIARRLTAAPVAYLTGAKEFMGLRFAVGPGVLVPRPETELLVEWAEIRLPDDPGAVVVDAGTGSGAIILALAALAARAGAHRSTLFVGSDLSVDALAYAERNRAALGLTRRVELVRGDLLAWLGRPARLILANLPYLRPDQVIDNVELAAEPAAALVAGNDGLDLIRRLVADLPRVLARGGELILEIDPSQAAAVRELVSRALPDALIAVMPDLSGSDRFVTARRPVHPDRP